MSDVVNIIRAIVREELTRHRSPQLGIVTEVFPGDGAENNHQVSVKLRSTGVELQRVPVIVGRLGFSMLPEVGHLVLLAFVDGELNAPVVIGSIYDSENQPPEGGPLETIYKPVGDEDSSIRRLHLELPSGCFLTMDDDKLQIESGGTTVVIERDGDVTIKSAAKVAIESTGDITLDAGGNLQLSAKQNVSIKGLSTAIEGQADAKLKGPMVTLAGMTSFSAS
ncbi:MAG TPA: phage baseplate assembly protein V [Pyrinomonadaceae bacterium]|nr:phage baseplate assembly protein V [Pyrinomonadaceae bacterium]